RRDRGARAVPRHLALRRDAARCGALARPPTLLTRGMRGWARTPRGPAGRGCGFGFGARVDRSRLGRRGYVAPLRRRLRLAPQARAVSSPTLAMRLRDRGD